MFDNQSFNNLNEALTLKSALQDVANRGTGLDEYAVGDPSSLTLKEFDTVSKQFIPTQHLQPIQMRVAPRHGQLFELKDDNNNTVLSQVVIPADPDQKPYLKKLSSAESATLKGTRTNIEVIKTAASLAPAVEKISKPKNLFFFLEPAERLVFSIFSRMLHIEDSSGNAKVYLWELILILILAVLALLVMWYQAIAQL